MSASIQEKLGNLRRMKEERERLSKEIKTIQENITISAAAQAGARSPRITSWDRHQLSIAADTQTTADWVNEDFQNFHRDKIENKLKTARARVLVQGVMSDADAAYQSRVRSLGVDNLASLQDADGIIATRKKSLKSQRKNPLIQPHTATKRIVISADPSTNTNNLAHQLRPNPAQSKIRSAKMSSSSSRIPFTLNYNPTPGGRIELCSNDPSFAQRRIGGMSDPRDWANNPVSAVSNSGNQDVEDELEYEIEDKSENEMEDNISETLSCPPTEQRSRDASPTALSSRAASVLGDDEKRQVISEYLDIAYARIIKIAKVYFIRALYFDYQMPTQEEIAELKDRLVGHLHIPRPKWRTRLPLKSRIEYLNITRDGRVELATAWVMRIKGFHLFVSHNMTGGGKGVKNKWRKLTPHFPVFHKITNCDIRVDCGFLDDGSCSETESQSDFSELADMTDIETDQEYTSAGEEYDSD